MVHARLAACAVFVLTAICPTAKSRSKATLVTERTYKYQVIPGASGQRAYRSGIAARALACTREKPFEFLANIIDHSMAAPARIVGIALVVVLVVGAELVAVPEARLIRRDSPSGVRVVTGSDGESAGVQRASKWNRGKALLGEDKRSVPGGPDPQHHY
ncbi:hypothetical protein HU200_023968 [Digitaria exilis]|uniref:Uncharacterized protein n=1 Tax=Digitaria exilis TaxID=1010633 RepID=A0A835EWM6_9POAL|nr:hypothetical protein HU200_023968 [Digitaria exilis]